MKATMPAFTNHVAILGGDLDPFQYWQGDQTVVQQTITSREWCITYQRVNTAALTELLYNPDFSVEDEDLDHEADVSSILLLQMLEDIQLIGYFSRDALNRCARILKRKDLDSHD
jgi:hypothetical protein